MFSLIASCGQIKDAKKIAAVVSNDPAKTSQNSGTSAVDTSNIPNVGPYTPGSYFKILTEVDSAKDTRLYQFHYFGDGTFKIEQKSFPAGKMESGFFHLSKGTYKEDKDSGTIVHTVTSDSCDDLSERVVTITGDAGDLIKVTSKGQTLQLYSALSWSLPKSFSSSMGPVTEDLGCKKF